jgi:salicylate hydroxylase
MSPASSRDSIFENRPSSPIAIVGGGIAGLALAIGLVKHGIHVRIYEAASEFAEIGAGVASGPNATRALGLIDDRLLAGYKKHATFNDDPTRDDTFLSFRWGMDERKLGGYKAGDYMWDMKDVWDPEAVRRIGVHSRSCIHRARLLEVLVELLPDGIASFGKSLAGIEELADGTVQLDFEDGTTAQASALVGCDGIKSKVRGFVCGPDVRPTYIGEYAYRAMVPRAEAEKALGLELARNGQLYCGYNTYMVTYPVEHGDFTNMVAIPHDPGDAWAWDHDEWTVPASKEDFVKDFEGWNPVLVDVFRRYCHPYKWALFNVSHSAPYYNGRICLLGDSAHATTPHLGAGAGLVMEDAYVLSNLVASAKGVTNLESAFRAYDAVRRPRTQQVIEYSRQAGLATQFLHPNIRDDSGALREHFNVWFRWLWHEENLEAQLEEAKKLLLG